MTFNYFQFTSKKIKFEQVNNVDEEVKYIGKNNNDFFVYLKKKSRINKIYELYGY